MGVEREVRIGTEFGDALRARRLAAGISEVRLATMIKVRLSEVRVWETGGAIPSVPVVRALAQVLHLDSVTARQWLHWAGAVPEPISDREVSIELLPDRAPADPFAGPSVVVDLTERRALRAVPPPAIRAALAPIEEAPRPPASPRPFDASAIRPVRPVSRKPVWSAAAVRPAPNAAAVFPQPGLRTYVYSDAGPEPIAVVRRTGRRRFLVMVAALAALGFLLWWAVGQLGHGFASVVDQIGALGVPD